MHAAFEQWIAFVVVGIQIADDENVAGIVMNQRALGMLALGMRGVRQAFGDDVVAEGNAMRRALAPLRERLAGEARTGRRERINSI